MDTKKTPSAGRAYWEWDENGARIIEALRRSGKSQTSATVLMHGSTARVPLIHVLYLLHSSLPLEVSS